MISTVDLLVSRCLDLLLFILKLYFVIYKTTYLNEEINCTEPYPPARVPCFQLCISCNIYLNQTSGQIEKTEGNTDRKTDRQKHIYKGTDRQTNIQTGRQTDKWADKQITGRQILLTNEMQWKRWMERQTDIKKIRQIDL